MGPNGKANVWLSVFGSMMRHAIRIGLRNDNPAAKVPILKTGEHEPWPADLLRVCLEKAAPMTRLAIVTGLCSGQRIGDVICMRHGWLKDGIMQFTQQKVRRGGVTKDVAVPSEVGEILGMLLDMVRHYGKRASALTVARGAVDRMSGGKIVAMTGTKGQPA